MLTSRKASAKHAKHLFLKDYNDINFYIEDKDKVTKKVFLQLLKSTFPELRLSNIFPLGGRSEVVKECRKSQEKGVNEKAIYIIDGDIYLLTGEFNELYTDLDDLTKLFVLPRYCIENFLIEEKSISDLLDDEDQTRDKIDLESELAFENWLNKQCELFKELYLHYAISMKLKMGIPTISQKLSSLISSGSGDLDAEKVNRKSKEIKEKIIELYGELVFDEEYNRIKGNINDNCDFALKYVSGKDHLFPLLLLKANSIVRIKSCNDNLKIRLAKKVSSDTLTELYEFTTALYPA
ncbi:DUF4435 domain-containing protein [Fusibacter sp. JL216-2]|uniref:DUF4435 domain-containing protein n=1 Tax=Fusibacter sp. JL216-2 TaxID=3071453 RepID=UPI003D34ED29